MPIINRIAEFHDDMTAWRHDLHQHPELAFQEVRTAASWRTSCASSAATRSSPASPRTGVVGVIRGRGDGRRHRAPRRHGRAAHPRGDRASPTPPRTPGVMHACGHDGHTAMLLGAARYLAETRNFSGTVYVIFQPAEEMRRRRRGDGEGGAVRALPDGPRLRPAQLARRAGRHLPVARRPGHGGGGQHRITVTGKGAHGAMPHQGNDPIVVAAARSCTALQSIVAPQRGAGGGRAW